MRNMLLYSDERSAQLRKAMTRSDLARRVLEPFLERAVDRAVKAANEEEDAAEAEEEYFERRGGATTTPTRGDEKNDATSASASATDSVSAIRHVYEALSALVAATYKTGALRRRALVSGDDASARGPLGAASARWFPAACSRNRRWRRLSPWWTLCVVWRVTSASGPGIEAAATPRRRVARDGVARSRRPSVD